MTKITQLNKLLQDYGLTNNESLIYAYLVEHVEATAYTIAQELHIPRATVYITIESLKKKGLLSTSKRNNIRYHTPNSLSSLADIVEKKQNALDEALPLLRTLAKKARIKSPSSRHFVGREQVKKIWEEMLDTYIHDNVKLAYGITHSDIFRLYPKYIPQWIERRRKIKGMTSLLIFPESDRPFLDDFMTIDDVESVRYLPDKYLYSGEVTTFGDGKKVAIMNFDQERPEGVIIESKEITQMLERQFEFMWDMAEAIEMKK